MTTQSSSTLPFRTSGAFVEKKCDGVLFSVRRFAGYNALTETTPPNKKGADPKVDPLCIRQSLSMVD